MLLCFLINRTFYSQQIAIELVQRSKTLFFSLFSRFFFSQNKSKGYDEYLMGKKIKNYGQRKKMEKKLLRFICLIRIIAEFEARSRQTWWRYHLNRIYFRILSFFIFWLNFPFFSVLIR